MAEQLIGIIGGSIVAVAALYFLFSFSEEAFSRDVQGLAIKIATAIDESFTTLPADLTRADPQTVNGMRTTIKTHLLRLSPAHFNLYRADGALVL